MFNVGDVVVVNPLNEDIQRYVRRYPEHLSFTKNYIIKKKYWHGLNTIEVDDGSMITVRDSHLLPVDEYLKAEDFV